MATTKKTIKGKGVEKEKGLPDRFTSDPRGIKFINKKSTAKKGK